MQLFAKGIFKRYAFLMLLGFFAVCRAYCEDSLVIKVVVVRNTFNTLTDETVVINEAFNRFIKQKEIVDSDEIEYYSQKAKSSELRNVRKEMRNAISSENDSEYDKLLAKQRELSEQIISSTPSPSDDKKAESLVLPVQVSTIDFKEFDIRALFQQSRILVEYIVRENDCDYVLIPASLLLDNNLVRARLILYSNITKRFDVIYDKIIRQAEFSSFVRDNYAGLVGLFPYFLPKGMGILNFPAREFGYEVFYKGDKVESGSIFAVGKKAFTVSSPGYEDAKVEMDIKEGVVNDLEFVLKERVNRKVFFRSDGPIYNAFSSEKGFFTVPEFIVDYKTPQSISFSYPNYSTKYISLLGGTDTIDISLKPNYLVERSYNNAEMKDFYKSVLLSISFFAADIVSRSFLNAYPDSSFWQIAQKTASYAGYFSISLIIINLFDYFHSTVYAFE